MGHGRAIMPFGKYRGVRIRLLPDGYLSWMTTILSDDRWRWLKDSLVAELRFRGLRADLADSGDVPQVEAEPEPQACSRRIILAD